MLAIANYHIMFSYWIIPNGLALAFIPIIVYLLMDVRQERYIMGMLSVGLLIMATIFTHVIAVLMLAVVLFLIWAGYYFYTKIQTKIEMGGSMVGGREFLVISLSVMGIGLASLLGASGHFQTVIDLVRSGFTPGYFSPLSVTGVPVWEQIFNYSGFFLFCVLGFVGIIVAFNKNILSRKGFAFAFTGLIILLFTALAFVSQRSVMIGRWYYLSQILLAIPIGVVLVWLGGMMKRKILNACLVGLLVFALAFLIVMSPQENMDNRTFGQNTIVRSAFTQEELDALNEVSLEWHGKIAVDMSYYAMRRFYRMYDMSPQLVSRDFSECSDMLVLVRDGILEEPCKIDGYGIAYLDYDPRVSLVEQGYAMVYNNSEVKGYARVL